MIISVPMLVMALAAAVILVWPLWRRTTEPLPVGLEDPASDDVRTLASEKRRLLLELQRLRQDRLEGRLGEDDFRQLEAEHEAEVAEVMRRLDGLAKRRGRTAQAQDRPALHRIGSVVLLTALVGLGLMMSQSIVGPSDAAGEARAERSALAKALAELELRLAEQPDDVGGWILAARSRTALGDPGAAIEAWTQVLALEPDYHDARLQLVALLLQSRHPVSLNAALEHLEALLRVEPHDPLLLWYHGVNLAALDRHTEAAESLEAVLRAAQAESELAELARQALQELGGS
jgi:cytochrome c-type biogenesis protein CcmH